MAKKRSAKYNKIMKPLRELKEYPDNCRHLCRLVLNGVSYAMAYRQCFGASADNMSDANCTRHGKQIYQHPKMRKFLNELNRKADRVAIKKAATTKEDYINEIQELKALALFKQNAKGQVTPDLKNAIAAHKMLGEAQGFFKQAQEVNLNIRHFLDSSSEMKTIEKAVVEEVDQISSLPHFKEFKEV